MILSSLHIFLQNASLQTLAPVAIAQVVKSLPEGILIALFASALLRFLPRQNSRTRFAVWFLALFAVAAMPLFEFIPHRPFSSLLAHTSVAHTSFLSHASTAVSSAAISLPAQWATVIFIVWAFAVCVMALRLAVGLWRLRELRRSCTPVNLAELDPALQIIVAELNSTNSAFARQITLATSDRVRVPAAIGLWSPMVVLPSWTLRDLPPSDLGIILRHESAHLRHWDDWTNLAQKLVGIVFFFHPAVWWIDKRLSVEREMACDDVVVAQTSNPTGYAACLVNLLERSLAERGWNMAHALVHRAREASLRLARILDKNRPVATRISKPALGLVGAFTVFCLVLLPSTPQVISFEQRDGAPSASAATPANDQYAAALAHAAIVPATLKLDSNQQTAPARAIPATFKTESDSTASPRSGTSHFATSKPVPPSSQPTLEQASTEQADQQTVADLRTIANQQTIEGALAERALAERFFMASVSNVMFQQSLFEQKMFDQSMFEQKMLDQKMLQHNMLDQSRSAEADDDPNAEMPMPGIVLVHATQTINPDSGASTTVWHVRVLRIILINPKPPAPASHST